jgi:hypothetical protein
MRLSFMISSRRSGVDPPPNPSAVSARPSSWKAPVTSVRLATASAAATKAPSPSIGAPTSTTAPTAPMIAPATGSIRGIVAKSGGPYGSRSQAGAGTGRRE